MKHNPLELQLKTLTPLWTGGITTMDRIHESSIIGSLRWWYEAIVRGLGGDVCDTTGAGCTLDSQKYKDGKKAGLQDAELLTHAGLCPVCQLFGATGWRRRFRLSINTVGDNTLWKSGIMNIRPHGRHRGWYLPPGYVVNLQMRLTGELEALERMATLLHFLETWGGIGAKQPLGYGRFAITNQDSLTPNYHLFDDTKSSKVEGAKDKTIVPSLKDFHFYRVQFRPRQPNWWTEIDGIRQVSRQHWSTLNALAHHGAVPVSPVIKNFWRFEQRWPSRSVAEWLFGKLERNEQPLQSRVSVGWAMRQPDTSWVIAGWAWLPQDDNLYHLAEAHHHMKTLLSNQALWLKALKLDGKVSALDGTMMTGLEAWNERKGG